MVHHMKTGQRHDSSLPLLARRKPHFLAPPVIKQIARIAKSVSKPPNDVPPRRRLPRGLGCIPDALDAAHTDTAHIKFRSSPEPGPNAGITLSAVPGIAPPRHLIPKLRMLPRASSFWAESIRFATRVSPTASGGPKTAGSGRPVATLVAKHLVPMVPPGLASVRESSVRRYGEGRGHAASRWSSCAMAARPMYSEYAGGIA